MKFSVVGSEFKMYVFINLCLCQNIKNWLLLQIIKLNCFGVVKGLY